MISSLEEEDLRAIHTCLHDITHKSIYIDDKEYEIITGLGGARHIFFEEYLFTQELAFKPLSLRDSPVTSIWAFGSKAGYVTNNKVVVAAQL